MGRPLRIGSLFTGIAGLDLSVEWFFAQLGYTPRVAWQVERDPYCLAVLARHYPDARRIRDVREVGPDVEAVEAVAGGFPCQPASLAGQRKGMNDERWLWPEFARVVRVVRPRYVFVENVPGLLTVDGGRAFEQVLGDLATLGFAAEWGCFRASDVGAPHRRERLFLLAYRDGVGEPQPGGGKPDEPGRPLDGGEERLAESVRIRRQEVRGDTGGVASERSGGARPRGRVGVDQVDPDDECGEAGDRRALPARAAHAGPRGGVGRHFRGSAQPAVGGMPHGLPDRLDAHRWPAGRGEPQHSWEPPRTASKVPFRPARMKALGNAVVWVQAAFAWCALWRRAGLPAIRVEVA